MMTMTVNTLGGKNAAAVMIRKNGGIDAHSSKRRDSPRSIQPPKYPAKKKKIKGGRSAPSLVGAKKRLNPDWVLAYLENPSVFKPVKAMPTFAGILSAKDMMNVARYVSNFK